MWIDAERNYCHPNFFRPIAAVFSGAVRLGQAMRRLESKESESGLGVAGRFRLSFSRLAPVNGAVTGSEEIVANEFDKVVVRQR